MFIIDEVGVVDKKTFESAEAFVLDEKEGVQEILLNTLREVYQLHGPDTMEVFFTSDGLIKVAKEHGEESKEILEKTYDIKLIEVLFEDEEFLSYKKFKK